MGQEEMRREDEEGLTAEEGREWGRNGHQGGRSLVANG